MYMYMYTSAIIIIIIIIIIVVKSLVPGGPWPPGIVLDLFSHIEASTDPKRLGRDIAGRGSPDESSTI